MHEALISLVGTTVGEGRFRIDRTLGQGGMGAVFVGVEIASGREVAIKLMHPGLGEEPRHVARFRREAEVTARLSHPHVVEVVAAGGGEGAPPFIAMELLEGASVSERLKAGETFDVERTVQIARQVLSALSAGHAIGVVHRDLKPANVMLVDGHSGQIAKVVDYGVARLAMSDAMTKLTATGQVVGTPSYMAPEQAMGAPADARSDVFSVGAIMHRLLAGEPPYGGGSYVDLLRRIVGDERRRIHESVPGLGRVADVIERALAHDPEGRFASAEEMDRALSAVDPTPNDTIVDWRPPADLAALRLAPAPDDAPVHAALVEGSSQAPAQITATAQPRRGALRTAALVAGALILGVVGTWAAVKMAASPAPSDASVTAVAVADAPIVPAAPVAFAAIDAAIDTSADASVVAVDAGAVRHRHRAHFPRAPGRDVFLEITSSTGRMSLGGRSTDVPSILETVVDFSACWPMEDPFPPNRRSTGFAIVVDASGRVQSVTHLGRSIYPELDQCITRAISNQRFSPEREVEGRTTIGLSIRPVEHHRRRLERQRVRVRLAGSVERDVPRGTGTVVRQHFNATGDFGDCWPLGRPLPESNRGQSFDITIAPDGRIVEARVHGRDYYPAFSRCAIQKLLAATIPSDDAAGEMQITFGLYPAP